MFYGLSTPDVQFFQAMVTLSFWSYVHFTYIVEPEDCLMDVKERPFPSHEILQVCTCIYMYRSFEIYGICYSI